MTNRNRTFAHLSVLLGTCIVGGCTGASGPATYDVQGKVTKGGEPLPQKKIAGQKIGGVQVWLVKEGSAPPEKKRANVQEDGTFTFTEGNKPTAGKYKVCLKWQDDYPLGPDKLNGKFDEKTSKIFRTIPEDKEINIDVSRPEG